jgi:hypothetical protein
MRIRKGKRCLPLAPADRSFAQEAVKREKGDVDGKNYANQALLRLVALAATSAPGADIISGRRAQYLVLLIIADCRCHVLSVGFT